MTRTTRPLGRSSSHADGLSMLIGALSLTLGASILAGCQESILTTADDLPSRTTGTLDIEVATTGVDAGASYVLTVDGEAQSIPINHTLTLTEVAAGSHQIDLADEDYNCRVTERPQGPVSVVAGDTLSVRFTVECRSKEIAFISRRDNGNYEMYSGSVNGEPTRILELPGSTEDEPAWSPSGQLIAFASDHHGDFDVFTLDAMGQIQNLTSNPAAIEGMPTWSPDGGRIAYRVIQNGNEDIWVMNADGTDQHPIVASPARERLPSWSPDGQSIAFVSDDDGSDDIWVLDVATLERFRRTPIDDAADEWPSWSPDGEHIAFSTTRDGNTEVYLMDADGRNSRNLSQAPGSNEWLPSWSPDGKYLSFNTDRDGNLDIYWMRSDGDDIREVTTSLADDFFATWNPAPWPE